ncbi:MAG: hypothetical protein MRZ79_08850 [Bacteroidia bacterium]|nr:hypothetical protein [Bacteroidia bacterium]
MKTPLLFLLLSTCFSFANAQDGVSFGLRYEYWKKMGLALPEWDDYQEEKPGLHQFKYAYWPGLKVAFREENFKEVGSGLVEGQKFLADQLNLFNQKNNKAGSTIHQSRAGNLSRTYSIYKKGRNKYALMAFIHLIDSQRIFGLEISCKKCIDLTLQAYIESIYLSETIGKRRAKPKVNYKEEALSVSQIRKDYKIVLSVDSVEVDQSGWPSYFDINLRHIRQDSQVLFTYPVPEVDYMRYATGRPKVNFVNEKEGFLYGYYTSYVPYPYFYRTSDGGKSWQKTDSIPGSPFPINIKMYDSKRGVLINTSYSAAKVDIFLTKDGWLSWAHTSIDLLSQKQHKEERIENVIFRLNEQGEILIHARKAREYEDYIMIWKSSNQGQKFRKIQAWRNISDDYEF